MTRGPVGGRHVERHRRAQGWWGWTAAETKSKRSKDDL